MPDTMDIEPQHCLTIAPAESLAGGSRPWSPGRREEDVDIERAAANPDKIWCMAEVDIFCDLDEAEMDTLSAAAPMKTWPAGALIYTPHQPVETLFILKKGRIRIFRVSPEGRALTTAIIEPGTIFGEMVIVGQQMHDSFAEALDDVVVCVMTKADVRRLLLGDPRIAARISETLGKRLGELEQRLSDAVFKTVPERIAGTLVTLAAGHSGRPLARGTQVKLTHEQLAALAATSRETTTKVLGEFADQGLITLGRGRITILAQDRLRRIAAS
jgi:CRP/FNR family cyclic AMP-dependent transcriptional regulator